MLYRNDASQKGVAKYVQSLKREKSATRSTLPSKNIIKDGEIKNFSDKQKIKNSAILNLS